MKKQSKSQKIGTLAEVEFERAGLRAGVLPEKVRKDFGVDYLCQVASPPDGAGTAIVGGAVIGAAVRGTDNRKPKIRLSRKDVSQLLSAEFPICLVLVHGPSRERPQLFFRFIDEAFSSKLADSLRGGVRSMVVGSNDLLEWHVFAAQLELAKRPGFVERIRLNRARRAVGEILPRSRLVVQRTEHGELTIVSVSDFFGQFVVESPDEKRQLHMAAFGASSHFAHRFAALRIKPALIDALQGLPNPVAITSMVVEDAISVSGPTGRATCTFERRHTSDHYGWVHASGFSVTISHAVQEGGRWVHIVSSQTDAAIAVDLQAFADLWEFLEKCEPGSQLDFSGGLVLETDGIADLLRYGYFARHLRSAARLHSWPSGTWLLADASADETLHTLAWLSALREKIHTIEGWGMVVGGATDAELETGPGAFVAPVCANLPRGGLVTWLTVDGHHLTAHNEIVGFRVLTVRDVEFEMRDSRFVKTAWPELVLNPGLATVLIPAMQNSTTSSAEGWGVGIRFDVDTVREEQTGFEGREGGV